MKLKFAGAVVLVLLAFAGAAQASGVFSHQDSAKNLIAQRVQALEHSLRIEGEASSSRVRRGPKGSRGPRGPRGPQGPKGATGLTGPKGAFGSVVSPASAPITLCPFGAGGCAVGGTRVECPPGTVLTGGGYIGAGILTTVTWSASIGNAWAIIAVNLDDEASVTGLKAVAQCAGP